MTRLTPDMMHRYQKDSITELYEHDRILGVVPTGGGKTVVALSAFVELRDDGVVRRGVVLGPRHVATTVWPKEPDDWSHLHDRVQVTALTGGPAKRAASLSGDADLFTLCTNSVEWLADTIETWSDDDPRLDLLIVDEVSMFKDPRGKWAKILRKRLAPRFRAFWPLTGTPRPNTDLDYFVPLSALTGDALWGRSYDKWRRKFFYPTDYEQRVWHPHTHLLPELRADVARHAFRVPKTAVPRPASPPIVHHVDLPPTARAAYRQMERDLVATLDDTDILAMSQAVASGKLAQLAQGFIYETFEDDEQERETHAVHDVKLDALDAILTGAERDGNAAMILYQFNEDLERLRAFLPGLPYLGDGVSDKEAARIEQGWNAGDIPIMALHPASAGHGLNLQKVSAEIVHYALTWSAELYEQVVARIARQGYVGTNGEDKWIVRNHHIVARDTVDEAKMLRVQGKLTAQQAALQYINAVRV